MLASAAKLICATLTWQGNTLHTSLSLQRNLPAVLYRCLSAENQYEPLKSKTTGTPQHHFNNTTLSLLWETEGNGSSQDCASFEGYGSRFCHWVPAAPANFSLIILICSRTEVGPEGRTGTLIWLFANVWEDYLMWKINVLPVSTSITCRGRQRGKRKKQGYYLQLYDHNSIQFI